MAAWTVACPARPAVPGRAGPGGNGGPAGAFTSARTPIAISDDYAVGLAVRSIGGGGTSGDFVGVLAGSRRQWRDRR